MCTSFMRGNLVAFHNNHGAHICAQDTPAVERTTKIFSKYFHLKIWRFPTKISKKEKIHNLGVTQSISWILNTNFKLVSLKKKVHYTQKKRFILLAIYIQIHYVCKSLLWLMDWICFWTCTPILVFIHTLKHHSYIK